MDALTKERDKLQAEKELLKAAIESFGNNPAGFDWAILERLDKLEGENEQLKDDNENLQAEVDNLRDILI